MKTLLDAISSGKIRINEELPPERELAENLGIGARLPAGELGGTGISGCH